MDTSQVVVSNEGIANVALPEEPKVSTSSTESPNASSSVHETGATYKGGEDSHGSSMRASSPAKETTNGQFVTTLNVDASESTVKPLSTGEIEAECGSAGVENVGSRNDDWYEAIEGKDCKKLLEMLQNARSEVERLKLLQRKGEEKRNALHVACMQGCLPLVKEICPASIFPNGTSFIMGDLIFLEGDGRSSSSAKEMADVIGNKSIELYLEDPFHGTREPRTSEMYKAYERSEWNLALEQRDSLALQKLVQVNSRYLLEYSYRYEWSVLDVAIEKDNMDLVTTVMGLFNESDSKICWGESFYPSELSWDRLMKGVGMSAMDLARKVGSKEMLERLSHPVFGGGRVEPSLHSAPVTEILSDIVAAIDVRWKEEWNDAYDADVDYNFEDEFRRKLLRFHYICKDGNKIRDFCGGDRKFNDKFLEHHSKVHDAQGRTAFQTMIDSLNIADLERSFFWMHFVHSSDDDVQYPLPDLTGFIHSIHLRGMTSIMRVLTKEYLNANTCTSIFIQDNFKSVHQKYTYIDEELHMAIVLENKALVELILKNQNEIDKRGYLIKYESIFSEYFKHSPPPLSIVAVMNNQTILRIMLREKFDPMVMDSIGRTSLHYAADPSLLEFDLPYHYFKSMEDYKKVKELWLERRKLDESDANRKACILMLLQYGVDLSQEDKKGEIPDPGTTNNEAFLTWWHELLFKDTTDKKTSFNQAGNALSVVGTLVAATSYVGPLQPPLGLNEGYLSTNKVLIRMFVVTNTLAFYLAISSVMFAVVPSLPMPQEGMIEELRRTRHTVSFSLCLLLGSILCIIMSFASATAVVMDNDESLQFYSLLLSPSIIGWVFCLVAIVIFFIRLMRLIFYKNSLVRSIYKCSFSNFCRGAWKVAKESVGYVLNRNVIGRKSPKLQGIGLVVERTDT